MENYWRVFKPVVEGHHYIISGDAAGGEDEMGDCSASWVLDIEEHEQVAAFNEIMEPDSFARELMKVGNYYNEGIIAVEAEKYGLLVINKLMQEYPVLYYHTIKSTGMKPTAATQFGWSPRYKDEAITRLQVDFSYNARPVPNKRATIKIYDKQTLQQMSTFNRLKKKGVGSQGFKIGAARGKKDDLVTAGLIANYVWHEIKDWYVTEETPEETEEERKAKYWEKFHEEFEYSQMDGEFWSEDDYEN